MTSTAQEQQLIVGQAATVVGYPPTLAQPSSVTARVLTPARQLPDTGEAGTVDTTSTTLSAAASRGATALSVGSATFVRGRQYLLTDGTTGAVVVVEAAKGGTLTTLPLASPLPCDVASGSTLKGYAVLFALADSDVGDDPGRGVCLWSATVDGVVVPWAQDLRVVRRRVAYTLTASDVEKLSPYATTLRPANDDDWQESIAAAWALYLVPAMLAKGAVPERIVSWEAVMPWHLAALEHHLATTTPESDPDIRQEKRDRLVEARDLALASVRFWVDMSEDVAPPSEDPNAVRPFTVTYITR